MLGTSTRSGFRRGCGRASWRPPSDLVDQVHVSGALSGARTGKGPPDGKPTPNAETWESRSALATRHQRQPCRLFPRPPPSGAQDDRWFVGDPLGLTPPGYELAPHTGLEKAPPRTRHEGRSMPQRLLIGPGSPPSIDPVHPELSPPPEPCPKRSQSSRVLHICRRLAAS